MPPSRSRVRRPVDVEDKFKDVRDLFFLDTDNNKFKCKVVLDKDGDDERECGQEMSGPTAARKGSRLSNLKAHLSNIHPEVFKVI